jgi:hypothetical protein
VATIFGTTLLLLLLLEEGDQQNKQKRTSHVQAVPCSGPSISTVASSRLVSSRREKQVSGSDVENAQM